MNDKPIRPAFAPDPDADLIEAVRLAMAEHPNREDWSPPYYWHAKRLIEALRAYEKAKADE